jgi:hypothetical protein
LRPKAGRAALELMHKLIHLVEVGDWCSQLCIKLFQLSCRILKIELHYLGHKIRIAVVLHICILKELVPVPMNVVAINSSTTSRMSGQRVLSTETCLQLHELCKLIIEETLLPQPLQELVYIPIDACQLLLDLRHFPP